MTIVLALCLLGVACGGGGEGPAPQTPTPPGTGSAAPTAIAPAGEPQTFAEQVTLGQKLYGEHCASCHGANGEGGARSPKVVGLDKGALPLDAPATAKSRKVQFRTAADVGEWVAKNMPPGKGGSLSEAQYWAILAFDLKANGVESPKKIDATTAKEIVLHK
jgi:mono/diheme cytochrome c family protein